MTQQTEEIEPHPFAGMGSRPALEQQRAEARALLASRGQGDDQEQERALVRANARGDVSGRMERLALGAQADLAEEAARLQANAPHVEAQIEQMRQAKRQRDLRHARLVAQLPPERVTTRASDAPEIPGEPGTGPWEHLAARGFEAAKQRAGAGSHLPRGYEPDPDYRDDQPVTPGY